MLSFYSTLFFYNSIQTSKFRSKYVKTAKNRRKSTEEELQPTGVFNQPSTKKSQQPHSYSLLRGHSLLRGRSLLR